MIDFARITGFDWDRGNTLKNDKHGVTMLEAEQMFFVAPLVVTPDEQHSRTESRYRALGQTLLERKLAVIFTLRADNSRIRVISARDMHRKERTVYEQEA
ncbi:MAG: BrnT family toxin [Betaproteobacteria bacterium]|nr:BrnT family toxin [Betaproteobacteria bacterium]